MLVEIDVQSLCENDKAVIREHCGLISSTLIRASTESLIKLKYVTDNRDVENYVAACTVSFLRRTVSFFIFMTLLCIDQF